MTTRRKLIEVEAVDDKQEMPPNKKSRTPRGRTHLDKLSLQRQQGIKEDVQFDSQGRPIGASGCKLQSYVGILAREKVKITYDN